MTPSEETCGFPGCLGELAHVYWKAYSLGKKPTFKCHPFQPSRSASAGKGAGLSPSPGEGKDADGYGPPAPKAEAEKPLQGVWSYNATDGVVTTPLRFQWQLTQPQKAEAEKPLPLWVLPMVVGE